MNKIIFVLAFILSIILCSCSKEAMSAEKISEDKREYWLNNAEYLSEQLCIYTPVFSDYDIKIENEDIIMAFILSTRHIDFEDYIYKDSYRTETDIFYKAEWNAEMIQKMAYEVFGEQNFDHYANSVDRYDYETMTYSINLETSYNKYFKINYIDSKILDDKYISVTVDLSEDDNYEPPAIDKKEEVEILFEYMIEDTEFLRIVEYKKQAGE